MNNREETATACVKRKLAEILARFAAIKAELASAKLELESLYEQEHESSLRSLAAGEEVCIPTSDSIPKRVRTKCGQPLRNAVVVGHSDKHCRVSINGIEFNMRYDSLIRPGELFPGVRAVKLCREIEQDVREPLD